MIVSNEFQMSRPQASSNANACLPMKIQPNASRNEFAGWQGEFLKARIQAPAVDGKANQALLAFLCERSGLPKSRLSIKRGESSRQKWIAFEGIDRTALLQRLGFEDTSHG
jgi:uncharacterized protein (TIGR00251 family)